MVKDDRPLVCGVGQLAVFGIGGARGERDRLPAAVESTGGWRCDRSGRRAVSERDDGIFRLIFAAAAVAPASPWTMFQSKYFGSSCEKYSRTFPSMSRVISTLLCGGDDVRLFPRVSYAGADSPREEPDPCLGIDVDDVEES